MFVVEKFQDKIQISFKSCAFNPVFRGVILSSTIMEKLSVDFSQVLQNSIVFQSK